MQFRLVYQGSLRSNGNATHKQEIRRAFHPQLRHLWDERPLNGFRTRLEDAPQDGEASVIKTVGAFRFAPLICDEVSLLAELNVTILRPIPPGRLIRQGGDIDKQLKTLFDALRAPQVPAEIPGEDAPGEGENPFFCLLDDDERILIVLREVDGLSYDEIAAALGLPLSTVKTRLFRARQQLKIALGGWR